MKRLLIGLAMAMTTFATLTASETFVYTQESYQLLPREFNILRAGDAMCTYESTSTDGFYEQNAEDADCLTDGAIYFVSGYNERPNDRYLVRRGDTFTCRFVSPKRLDDVRFWTYWPDGARTDVTVASIDVTYDGAEWVTLPDTEFSASADESSNTILPYLGSYKPDIKARCVRFDGDSGEPLASEIRGVRVVFGPQEINYTVHWELEAKGGECYSGNAPVACISAVSSELDQTGESVTATVSGYLLSVGPDSSKTATLTVRWGTEEGRLNSEKSLEGAYSVDSPLSVELTGLEPGRVYYVQFDATVGDSAGSSEAFRFLAGPEPKTLIELEPFDDHWEIVENTQFGLGTNLPGGSWVCGGGWEWSQPRADKDNIKTDEEKACFALPLISTETYQKPRRITVSAVIAHSQGGGGVGFWHEVPLRSKHYPIEGGEEKRIYDATVGFTGIAFNPSQKTLRVYEAGAAVGDPVSVVTSGDKDYHTLTYTVDTADGSIEWVTLNARPVRGLASTAFTDANTDYVGILSLAGGRTGCKSMVVSEGKEQTASLILDLRVHEAVVFAGDEVRIPVKAMNSLTEAELSVGWLAPDCQGATFAEGEFVWTSVEPGTYTVFFSSSLGMQTATDSAVIRVYSTPPPEPTGMKPIIVAAVDLTGQHQDIRFAGTDQVDATDRTDLGLTVNKPGASWIWNSGWPGYGVPVVYAGSTEYDLANELSSVLLSLQSTDNYSKPSKLFVSTSFKLKGRGVCGFWSGLHDTVGQDVTGGFTGLCFERPDAGMRLYVNGTVVGAARRIEVPAGLSQYTLRFVLDIKGKAIKDVVFNGFPVGDFELPEFADELASYVGVGTMNNIGGREDSRMQLRSLRIDGEPKSGMVVVIR